MSEPDVGRALIAGLDEYDLSEEDRALLAAGDLDPDREAVAGPLPVLVLVGRPNVGKSTLLNRILGRREAVVEDFPGVTRDRVSYPAEWSGRAFLVVDTRVSHALVDGGYAARRADCERAVAQLGVGSLRDATLADLERLDDDRIRRRVRHVVTEIERVEEVVAAAAHGSWQRVGDLFVASHASMRPVRRAAARSCAGV